MAVICTWYRPPTHHIAQHTHRQRACGLDPHQPHPQHGKNDMCSLLLESSSAGVT